MKHNKRLFAWLLIIGGIVGLGVMALGHMFHARSVHYHQYGSYAAPYGYGYSVPVQPQQGGTYQQQAPQVPQAQPGQTWLAMPYTTNQPDPRMMYDQGSFGRHGHFHGPGALFGLLFCLGLPAVLGGLVVWFIMRKRQGTTPPAPGGDAGSGGNAKTDDSTANAHTTEQHNPEQHPYTGSTQVL